MAARKGADETKTDQSPKLHWDDSRMQSTYANVCNVASTQEEVTLLFGTNTVWHGGQQDVTVQLSNRVILNPHAAKRLASLLNRVVTEYEKRFGELKSAPGAEASSTSR